LPRGYTSNNEGEVNLDASKEPSRDRLRRPPGPCLSADAKDVRQRQTDVWFELLSPQPELENLNLPEQFMILRVIIIIAVLMRWFSSSPLPSRKLSVSSGT